MMRAENGILEILIVLKHSYIKSNCLSISCRNVTIMCFRILVATKPLHNRLRLLLCLRIIFKHARSQPSQLR